MTLQTIAEDYYAALMKRFGPTLNTDQWSALNALRGCRQGQYGALLLSCAQCSKAQVRPRSCGNRTCNQCQQHSAQHWLARQQCKQLPVDYFMATFTLPTELRDLARTHPKAVYGALMACATDTLKTFGLNKTGFESELGLCAVLHTHTRRLDYHPHVHVVIPGGGVHRARREWRKLKSHYLFNGRALAKVFRGRLLKALYREGLTPPKTPPQWVVQCQPVGKGKEALQYLSRYLYKGVISNNNILKNDGKRVTFRYQDSKTKRFRTRTLPGETFVWLVLQHVLPKGFRRARDYGFLHGNARALLKIVQWVLRVDIAGLSAPPLKTGSLCPDCKTPMTVIGFRPRPLPPG